MQITENTSKSTDVKPFALFNLSFRIFFLAATIFSVVSISYWTAIYTFQFSLSLDSLTRYQWHAHEMIYGYSFAVIAGFVLTAVKNWTGIQTPFGKYLMLIFGLWLVARVLFLFGDTYINIAAFFDLTFSIFVIVATAYPIIKAKKWMQLIILILLMLLTIFNILFYLGAYQAFDNGIHIGIYGGLLLVIGLILTMGRRVVPFFIERGVGYEVKLFNSKWLDISISILFFSFFISEVFYKNTETVSYLTAALFVSNGIRLAGWHTKGIWSKSLLWSLYVALWFINLGFLLFALSYFAGVSKYIAIHAFAYGGIGIITIAMMSRVALGHTGRDVSTPSIAIGVSFTLLIIGAFSRVLLPLFSPTNYLIWVGLSQVLWISAFTIFVVLYLPILTKPRIDNSFG